MKYKCYILDDEPLAINVIETYLAKLDQFVISGTSTNPFEAIKELKVQQPDLLFLDIEMPDLTGLDIMESIELKPGIIITTAYREYAVEGFEHNVLDYLVKPISFKRFIKSIDKFLGQKNKLAKLAIEDCNYLFVKADRKTLKIDLDHIQYIEGLKDYSRIFLMDQKIMTKVSVGNLFGMLPAKKFLRVHKSFIVAKNKITAFTAHDVEIGKIEIPIGRAYKEQFLKELNLWRTSH